VYVDPSLGTNGLQNAHDLLSDGDRITQGNDTIFGTTGSPVRIIIFAMSGRTDGTGGADHASCNFQTGGDIEVCAAFGSPPRVSALLEAELSECSMNGQLCGFSTGEALSRWCAASLSNNALGDFATAPDWVQSGKTNYVDKTESTDGDPKSTGCGMAFISWLLSLGQPLPKIAQAMVTLGDSGTLAALYESLMSHVASHAWPTFSAAIDGLSGGVTNDDPFNGMKNITIQSH